MKIGVFSKFDMSGGSEFRCAEMCNAIAKYTSHQAFLLCEKKIPFEISKCLTSDVKIILDSVVNHNYLYEMDSILVVNTDSKSFTTKNYWDGKSDRHTQVIDLTKIKQLSFLFNYILSPAQYLSSIEPFCPDIRLICANSKFFNELSTHPKFESIRHFKRMMLESPINPDRVCFEKTPRDYITIGRHSLTAESKFNEQTAELIRRINDKFPNVKWDFMGVPKSRKEELLKIPNVIVRDPFTLSVKEYLMGIDIFLFFPAWNRQEPWSRAVAEGLMSGCPVITTLSEGGNKDQILNGCNGYLCGLIEEFEKKISYLLENPKMLQIQRNNARFYSNFFTSEAVINKFVKFIA